MALGHRAEIGPFTSKGRELLELVAAGCQLVVVQSSSVDTWVTDPSNNQQRTAIAPRNRAGLVHTIRVVHLEKIELKYDDIYPLLLVSYQ